MAGGHPPIYGKGSRVFTPEGVAGKIASDPKWDDGEESYVYDVEWEDGRHDTQPEWFFYDPDLAFDNLDGGF